MNAPSRTARPFSFGPLYDFLFEQFPDHRSSQGIFDVPRFADDLQLSTETVYRFLRANRLNPRHTDLIVRLLNPGTAPETERYLPFLPFVFDLPRPNRQAAES